MQHIAGKLISDDGKEITIIVYNGAIREWLFYASVLVNLHTFEPYGEVVSVRYDPNKDLIGPSRVTREGQESSEIIAKKGYRYEIYLSGEMILNKLTL